ncbi:MAG: ATP-binding protein [Anaerolineae bacterium]
MSAVGTSSGTLDMLGDLRRELLTVLPLPSALAAFNAVLIADRVFGAQPLSVWMLGIGVSTTSLLAHMLRNTRPRLATSVYLVGLASGLLAVIWLVYAPLSVAFLAGLLVLTVALAGGNALAFLAVLAAAVTAGAAWRHRQFSAAMLGPQALIAFTALVAWLAHRNLVAALEWAWNSYRQALRSTEETRERRGELAKTLKALDEAYYRLERFSAQLAQAREAAEEARRAKQQFVATVSHELRTPLNIIIGFAELITLSPESYGVRGVPRKFLGDVNRIYRSAQHLKGLIDDVLDLSQIDARQMAILAEPGPLREVIVEAADMIWSLAAQKRLELRVEVPDDLPVLSFDRLRLRQVMLNLLSNAVRFTDAGSITVSACLDGSEVRVTVADTGHGIAPDDLGRVFDEFRQLDHALNRRHEGTGLGLALSRRFIELHGGRMWVESEIGRGSRFHLTLPLDMATAPQGDARVRSTPLPVGAIRERLLLVGSDDPATTGLLRRHLHGYAVQGVAPENLAASAARLLPYAAVQNGLLESDGMASPPERLPVPVITCPLPEPGYLGRRLGVDHYLLKPISRERLLELLARYGARVRRVLIVDDDVQMAELLARMVRALPGYEADVACGGAEGWSLLQEKRPDLLLLDLGMETLDGLDLLQLLRAHEILKNTPVAIITGRDLPGEAARLPGEGSIRLDAPASLTVSEALNCLQALLDALPPPRPDGAPPPRPPAAPPAQPAS